MTAAALGSAAPLLLCAGAHAATSRRLSSFDDRIGALLAQMTLDEKLGQMTQAELGKLEHEDDVERYFLGSVLSGGDADPPTGNGMRDWQQTIDAVARAQRANAPQDPDPLRRRRGARPQQRRGRDAVPAQHRPRVHARRRARRGRGACHCARDARDRRAVDFRAVHRGAARRALGADVRGVRRGSRGRRGARRGRGARLPDAGLGLSASGARVREALHRRRRHDIPGAAAGQPRGAARSGRHARRRGDAAQDPSAGLRRGSQRGRRLDHGVVQQLERREGFRDPPAVSRDPEGRARLRRVLDLGLLRDRPDRRRLQDRRDDLDQRRNGHGNGACGLCALHRDAAFAGRGRSRAARADRRRGHADPAREGGDGAARRAPLAGFRSRARARVRIEEAS